MLLLKVEEAEVKVDGASTGAGGGSPPPSTDAATAKASAVVAAVAMPLRGLSSIKA
jgi:hypothetical protein